MRARPGVCEFRASHRPGRGFFQQATDTSDYYTKFADDLGDELPRPARPRRSPLCRHLWHRASSAGPGPLPTLLVEPHSSVHLTAGLLPRKDIGMRRNWIAPGLSKLAPVFRFGPVLVDPKRIRMPIASDIRGTWSWSHRMDATTWADDPVVNSERRRAASRRSLARPGGMAENYARPRPSPLLTTG